MGRSLLSILAASPFLFFLPPHPRFPGTREWVAPSAPPTDWLHLVNQPQTEAEVAALRRCANRSRPFGDPNWVTDTVKRLGLECTVFLSRLDGAYPIQ